MRSTEVVLICYAVVRYLSFSGAAVVFGSERMISNRDFVFLTVTPIDDNIFTTL